MENIESYDNMSLSDLIMMFEMPSKILPKYKQFLDIYAYGKYSSNIRVAHDLISTCEFF